MPGSVQTWWTEGAELVVGVTTRDAPAERWVSSLGRPVRVVVEPRIVAVTDIEGGDGWTNDTSRCSVAFSMTGAGDPGTS